MAEGAYLFCAGDDDQQFSGSDPGSPRVLAAGTAGGADDFAVFNLTKTFRLPPEILSPALNLIQFNGDRIGKVVWTEKAPGCGSFTVKRLPTPVDEAVFAASTINSIKLEGVRDWADFAVLARLPRHLEAFRKVFVKMAVPMAGTGGKDLFDKDRAALLVKLLRVVERFGPSEDMEEVLSRSQVPREEAKTILEELHKRKGRITSLGALRSGLERLRLFGSRIASEAEDGLAHEDNLRAFLAMAREFEERSRDKTPGAFFRYIKIYRDSGLRREETGVRLMTIEQARGLEFPVVFIPQFVEGEFPRSGALHGGELERERRIAYIGMTRATERLFVTHASHRDFTMAYENKPSRFLKEMTGL